MLQTVVAAAQDISLPPIALGVGLIASLRGKLRSVLEQALKAAAIPLAKTHEERAL
jgi:hypothetical protein